MDGMAMASDSESKQADADGESFAKPEAGGLDLSSDAPLAGACDLSGEGTCEACQ